MRWWWLMLKKLCSKHTATTAPTIRYPDRPITQAEWLEGYWRWRKKSRK